MIAFACVLVRSEHGLTSVEFSPGGMKIAHNFHVTKNGTLRSGPAPGLVTVAATPFDTSARFSAKALDPAPKDLA